MRGPWNSMANLLDEALKERIDHDTLVFMKNNNGIMD
jgi:hypothetical protein